MNDEYLILKDKNNKSKKCVVNKKNKVLYVKKNNAIVKYVKHNNKFISKNEYVKLCKKKTKKMRGGDGDHIAYIDNNVIIIIKKGTNDTSDKKKFIEISYGDSNKLYFKIDEKPDLTDTNSSVSEIEKKSIWFKAIIENLITLSGTFGINYDSEGDQDSSSHSEPLSPTSRLNNLTNKITDEGGKITQAKNNLNRQGISEKEKEEANKAISDAKKVLEKLEGEVSQVASVIAVIEKSISRQEEKLKI